MKNFETRYYSKMNGEEFLEEIIDLVMMCGGKIMFKENMEYIDETVIHGLVLDSPENTHLYLLKSKKRSNAKIKKILCTLTLNQYNIIKNILKHLKNEIKKI